MSSLKILCNSCGACCERGGECIARNWDNSGRDTKFVGRCELLMPIDADGSQKCSVFVNMSENDAGRRSLSLFVKGICDFVDIRRDLNPP